MPFTRLEFRNGWQVPVNEKGEEDWLCPKCDHEHTSCCGNSHFPCKNSAQYGRDCKCDYADSLGSMDWVWGHFTKSDVVSDGSLTLLDGTRVNKVNP